jgi:hypothetical protein
MAAAALLALAAGAVTLAQRGKPRPVAADVADPAGTERGLEFRLSDGQPEGTGDARLPPAPARPLDDAATQRLLSRLPELPADAAPRADFALRDASLPPPRPGRDVPAPFPPPEAAPGDPPAPDDEPLAVLRHAPDGEVPLAPHLSVTFSRPMVAVTGVEDLATEAVPVRLTPTPPGRWRWVGTRTLLFEPQGRFAMASTFTVEVPAGTHGSTGRALERTARWTFSTPPVSVQRSYPQGGPTRRDTLLFAAFDQRVQAQDVLGSFELRADGRALGLRLADEKEFAADPEVSSQARAAQPGRFVVLKPKEPLPADSQVTVTLRAGAPSAEGPRRTTKDQSWSFRTFGPLRLTRHACGWRGECRPRTPFTLQFSNPLDRRAFRREWVRIEPPLPDAQVSVAHDSLHIAGPTRALSAYQVHVSPELRDVFGQTLGQPETRRFEVGAAEPSFTWQGGDFIVLDPAAQARLSVYTVRHRALRLTAYAVDAMDYLAFRAFVRAGVEQGGKPPGRRVIDTTVPVTGAPDEISETRFDLRAVFPKGVGHAVVIAEPTDPPKEQWRRRKLVAWVQSTRLGLSVAVDNTSLLAWVNALDDGRPRPDVELTLHPTGARAVSAADGLARFALEKRGAAFLVARQGDDVALLPEASSWWHDGGGWQRNHELARLAWYVIDDRGLYRPGEEARVKGFVRRIAPGPSGDVEPAGVTHLKYRLHDSQGNEIASGEREVGALGGFDLALKLPATMNLGPAQLLLDAATSDAHEAQHTHAVNVQEFRRPEFEVTASASEGPHVVLGSADLAVRAAYFAGGALSSADVNWRVTARRATYVPPGRSDFTFGDWTPWWKEFSPFDEPARTQTFAGRTDSAGRHLLRVDFDAVSPPRPSTVEAEAGVVDVNRQAWTARTQVLVHPSLAYVGLRSRRLFVQSGEPLRVETIATDLDGRALAGRALRLRAERLVWEQDGGEWREVPRDGQDCQVAAAEEAVECAFDARQGGAWRVTARVQDEQGRENRSTLRLWVAGGEQPPRRDVDQEQVELLPDRKEYRPGEQAEVLVLAPFAPAEGLVTLRRAGLVRSERFRMEGRSHTLRLPIEDAFTPNVAVQVDLVGAAPRDAAPAGRARPTRPAYASGQIDLRIPPHARTLALSAAPREARLEPGGRTTVDLALKDAQGRPVAGAELAVIVVDEAVLALSGYTLADPLDAFYPRRDPGVRDEHLRARLLLGAPEDEQAQTMEFSLVGGAPMVAKAMRAAAAPAAPAALDFAAEADAAPQPIRARVDFAALALFAAAVRSDDAGRAQVEVSLPDNLTRYRVMAVAAADARRFGTAESTLTARLPLMVRPSPPRFLNFGDRFELPVVVQNQTDEALDVDVAVRAANAALTAGAGRRVRVPANERVELRFPAAAESAGRARFQVAAASGRFADAADVSLPVWTPATTEAFATYGQLDAGSLVQLVRAPRGAVPGFGGLEVTTSSTALHALSDAVLYLVSYPYECSEQLASRVLAVAALRDVLAAFQAEGLPAPKEIEAAVARDLERLRALQNPDGSFGFWSRGEQPWPWLGVHVAHAFERARAKGYSVPDEALQRSRAYLRGIDGHIPKWYGESARRTLVAYALDVRARLGEADPTRAQKLVREAGVEALSFEALGFLLPTLGADQGSRAEAESVRRHLANRVAETAGAAHFAVSYGDDAYVLLHSDRRADAVLLQALIGDQPKSDLIPKLVAGLLAHRKAGRWTNTQENVFVLLALDRYFNAYEKTTPDFVARLWLGPRYAGEQAFRGRSTERRTLSVPLQALGAADAPLALSKDGPGRLYYRIGLRYAPADLDLKPLDAGFTVERRYEGVDAPGDVRRDPDGTWRVRAGSRVRSVLTLVAPGRRTHVALVDPLPAGLEAQNPSLALTGTLPPGPSSDVSVTGAPGSGGPGRPGPSWWWWTRPWFEHQNLRDERVEAFSSLLFEGVYTYSYVARATTPGTFVVPPAKAEEMYAPETFGRSATDRVVVE